MPSFLQEMSGNKWQSKDEAVGGPYAWCHTLIGTNAGIRFCLIAGLEIYRTTVMKGFDKPKMHLDHEHVFQIFSICHARTTWRPQIWRPRHRKNCLFQNGMHFANTYYAGTTLELSHYKTFLKLEC